MCINILCAVNPHFSLSLFLCVFVRAPAFHRGHEVADMFVPDNPGDPMPELVLHAHVCLDCMRRSLRREAMRQYVCHPFSMRFY